MRVPRIRCDTGTAAHEAQVWTALGYGGWAAYAGPVAKISSAHDSAP
ncbi:hypothetical protein [Streptomyces sp. LS1784]|nr:hypothetical protein [Streptomyces sp. LS1784]